MLRSITLLVLLLHTMLFSAAQDATALYNEGLKLKDEKKPAAAMEKFEKALLLKPGYTDALYQLGWCQNESKLYSKAITTLRTVRTSWSNIPKVHFELGYAFEKNNNADSAISSYNRCVQLKPYYANVYKQLGNIAYEKSEYEKAITYFKKHIEQAKNEITDYLFWYRKGFTENALKDYTAAQASLLKSLNIKTDYINTYLELGFAYTKLKQDDDAINYFKKAIDIDPKSHIPYNGIAEVYRDNKKNMTEAIAWYQKSLTINPNERKANYGLGYCSNSLGKYTEAITYLKKAIEYEATYTAAFVELGYSYYKTKRYPDALNNFAKALSQNPKNENARYYSGLVYIIQKDRINAQRMVDELKNLNSKNATSLQDKVNKM
ncbi:MAG: tetratricopeptide repeat protein [Ferruginibacter sp.]